MTLLLLLYHGSHTDSYLHYPVPHSGRIRDAIREGRISDATDVVNQLHPELLDTDRYLYFHLQQQHLIELIRAGRVEEALGFAQQSLAERGEENTEVLAELERTLALLAFEDPANCPFGDLLNSSHRQKVGGRAERERGGTRNRYFSEDSS